MTVGPIRRLFLQWYRFLPYHFARIKASRELLGPLGIEIEGLETASQDAIYSQMDQTDANQFPRHLIFPGRTFHSIPIAELRQGVWEALDRLRPDAIAINGYGIPDGRACLLWCLQNRKPAILLSESWEGDAARSRLKETAKSLIVSQFDAALTGGTRHREYIQSLGIPPERIFSGYDVIDNEHFAAGAALARSDEASTRATLGLPKPYILSCGRFVPEKNFAGLLEAYRHYRIKKEEEAWDLVLLGDGAESAALRSTADQEPLRGHVHFPGFVSYDQIPAYYGLAGLYVHPSRIEPWGLVVNEALASGLPVLVSDRCGCAVDLVHQGVNGYTFPPNDLGQLTKLLVEMTGGSRDLAAMGRASLEVAARYAPRVFATGLQAALTAAASRPGRHNQWRELLVRLSLRG